MSKIQQSGFGVISSTVPKVDIMESGSFSDVVATTIPSDEIRPLDRAFERREAVCQPEESQLKERLSGLIASLARADEIVDAYADLVRFYLDQSDFVAAEQVLEEVLSYGRESYGAQHPAVAPLFIELAFVNYHQDNFSKAKLLLETALFIQEKAYGEVSEPVAFIQHKLGRIQEALGNLQEAEEHYLRAVTVYQNTYIEDDSQILQARSDLARVRRRLK